MPNKFRSYIPYDTESNVPFRWINNLFSDEDPNTQGNNKMQ